MFGGVQAKTIRTALQPELSYLFDFLFDFRIGHIQIGHGVTEIRKIINLLARTILRPMPIVSISPRRISERLITDSQKIVIFIGGSWGIFNGVFKPAVLIRGVVESDIKNNMKTPLMSSFDQTVKIC